jgi:transposase
MRQKYSKYSKNFKDTAIKRMMPPNAVSVAQLCIETGVSDSALYQWKKDYRNRGIAVPSDQIKSDNWTAEDKLAVVIETASLNSAELSEYCRSKGLFVDQIQAWKCSALAGYQQNKQLNKEKIRNRHEDMKKIKNLESQLRRKDKALAETAALLVLSKKCEAIWGVNEED